MKKVDRSGLFTNAGSPVHILYSPVVSPDGGIALKESGKENTDEIINSFAETTDIRIILQRVKAGEVDLLDQVKGTYGDFTGTPKTLAEMLQLQIDSNKLFNSLPSEVKKKFDNDPNKFFAQSGTEEWFNKLAAEKSEQMRSMSNNAPGQPEEGAESSTTD